MKQQKASLRSSGIVTYNLIMVLLNLASDQLRCLTYSFFAWFAGQKVDVIGGDCAFQND